MNHSNTSQPVWSKESPQGLTGVEKRTGEAEDRGFFENTEGLVYYFVGVAGGIGESVSIARGPFLSLTDAKADFARDTTDEVSEFLGLPKDTVAHSVDGVDKVESYLKGQSIFKMLALAALLEGSNFRRTGLSPVFAAPYGKPREYEKKGNIHATIYGEAGMFSNPEGRNYEELGRVGGQYVFAVSLPGYTLE